MEIRRYNRGEESAVWNVYFAATHESNARDYHADLIERWAPHDQDMSRWADRLAQKNPFVAVVDEEIVGMAEIEPDGFINYFYVHPRWQKRGIGKALLATLESEATKRGVEVMSANVSITAKSFFLSRGFCITEAKSNVILGHPAPNFRMQKRLRSEPDGAANGSQPIRSEDKSNVNGGWLRWLTFTFGSTVAQMENNKSEPQRHLSFPFNGHHGMNWRSLMLSLVLCVPRASADALAGDLIAHYRFDTNGSDSLGRSPPFVVTNGDQSRAGVTYTAAFAVPNAPFTNGVLYVNGRYEPNGHFVHYLGTAPIKDLRYDSFTVGLDFYPLPKKRSRNSLNGLEAKLDSWTGGRYTRWGGFDPNAHNTDNILTGGYSYRWIGFNRKDGLLNLTLNNQSFAHQFKDVAVEPGRWHNLICSVDLQRRKILTMFDGHLLETITLPSDFKLEVAGSPGDATEREFTFDNHSNGSVFFGYAAHLKILGRALAESEVASLYNESLSEHPKYPRRHFRWPAVILILVVASLAVSLFLWLRIRRYRPGDSRIPKPP